MSIKSMIDEMAMDPGQGGHLIDPNKKAKINKGETPVHKLPAMPSKAYTDKAATDSYGQILKGVEKHVGKPQGLNQGSVMHELMTTLQRVQKIESGHESELEELAVAIILDLPEFKKARQAWIDGELRINANLMSKLPSKMDKDNQERIEPPDDTEDQIQSLGLNVPEIQGEFNSEIDKRKFINMLIQGAAVTKTHAYHLASNRLNQIDPTLVKLYGKLVALGDLSYWMKPEDMFGGQQGGQESIEHEEDGLVVNAYAINFPLLVHELVKGLYEIVAYNVVEDPTTREHVYSKADTLDQEEWHIMKGPAVWMHFNHIMNKLNANEFIPQVFSHLCQLSAGEFTDVVKGIFSETPESAAYLRNLVQEIKDEEALESEE